MSALRTPAVDLTIVGAGIAGSFIAQELVREGFRCVMLEAGRSYQRHTYPRNDLDGSAQLYWSGGLELSRDARLAFLRPKVVGGGSVVNQALVDRFDDDALDSWNAVSGVDFFSVEKMTPWYASAEADIAIQTIPVEAGNRNATLFQEGFEKLGYRLAPLRRAQKDCRYGDGNCCIECLNGCRIGSKQSMPETTLKRALAAGLELRPGIEVTRITGQDGDWQVHGTDAAGGSVLVRSGAVALAGGAVGNVRLLLSSGFGKKLPAVGRNFYCHPQYMNFGIYDEPVDAHMGAFQAFKSDDPSFRKDGFKLENVYAGPAAIALLVAGFGIRHHHIMERLSHFACIEVCTRDTTPGRITVSRRGKLRIEKHSNEEDIARYTRGAAVVDDIFRTTGAREILHGTVGVGLHLMGGCAMGTDPSTSVVDPEFRIHGHRRLFAADSSIFPNAPGINPSLTVMALAKMAAGSIQRNVTS
jgi:choline dehydrogenase-like flavoprotein